MSATLPILNPVFNLDSGSPGQTPMVRQLLDIVNRTIKPPLPLYPGLHPQAKPIEPLVAADVDEHRFDRCHAMTVYLLVVRTVDSLLRAVGKTRPGSFSFEDEGYLPSFFVTMVRCCGIAHAV